MKNKKIWIINHYATNMFFDKGGRHYYLSKYLKEAGYEVTVFCANTFHDSRKSMELGGKNYIIKKANTGVKFVFLKTNEYVGNGKARVMNMVNFYRSMMKCSKNFEKPDIIVGSSVHPLACIAAIKLSKKIKCKNIIEIRDLWPLSIVEYSEKWTDKNLLIRILYKGERWIYKKADALIFTMPGGAQYIKDKGWNEKINLEKIFNINNGVDVEEFNRNIEEYQIQDKDLEDSRIKIVYTGSIRKVNNVVEFAELGKYLDSEKYFFLIYGKGDYIEELKSYIRSNNLRHVKYKGSINKNEVPSVLARSDLNFFYISDNKVFQYGMSLNKLFEYMASGKPICIDGSPNYNFIEEKQLGISGDFEDYKELAGKIEELFSEEKQLTYKEYCNNCLEAAEEFDWKLLSKKFEEVINYVEEH